MAKEGIASTLPTGNEVLVVEDEPRVRTMLSHALKEMGFQSTLTPTAEAAIKALREHRFDVVILDLNLPGMDGIEFLKLIRQQQNAIEVIILTGFGDLEAAKTAIHLDVVDFISKPYTLHSLEVALDRARKRVRAKVIGDPGTGAAELFAEAEPAKPAPAKAFEEPTPGANLEELERRQILQALERHNGNRALAATELGISLRKLYYRLGQYQSKGLMSL